MGCEELIESLKKEAGEKVLQIRREAEEEAAQIRTSASLRLEALRLDNASKRSIEEEVAKVILEAEKRARMISLTAEDKLSARLFSLAASSLYRLRGDGYDDLFGKCVNALPPLPWQTAKVNPADQALAKKFFPKSVIVPDSAITGGVEVEAEEGRMKIINTLDKRLEKAWPQMLPDLLHDIYQKVKGNGTPAGH
jgi:V/A-type H+-transporting ATPase subunit E